MSKSKLQKQKEAEERASVRSNMSHKDQIARLDARFGPGLGAAKERARLRAIIDRPSKAESDAEEKPKKTRKKKQEA